MMIAAIVLAPTVANQAAPHATRHATATRVRSRPTAVRFDQRQIAALHGCTYQSAARPSAPPWSTTQMHRCPRTLLFQRPGRRCLVPSQSTSSGSTRGFRASSGSRGGPRITILPTTTRSARQCGRSTEVGSLECSVSRLAAPAASTPSSPVR